MSTGTAISGTKENHDRQAPARRAGILLAASGTLALSWPVAFPADILAMDSLIEVYRTIAERTGGWRLANIALVLAILLMVLGYRTLRKPLREGGQRHLITLGWWALLIFAMAAVVEAAVRVTYTASIARDVAFGAAPQPGFPHTWGAQPSPLLIVGSMLGLVALASFALATLRAGLVGKFVGWAATLTALTMLLTEPPIPLVVSVLPLGVGIVLHARSRRSSAPVHSPRRS